MPLSYFAMRPSVNVPHGLWQLNQQLGLRHSNITFEIEGALMCVNPVACCSCVLQYKGTKVSLEVAVATNCFSQLLFHYCCFVKGWNLEVARYSMSFPAFLRGILPNIFTMSLFSHIWCHRASQNTLPQCPSTCLSSEAVLCCMQIENECCLTGLSWRETV